MRQSFLGWKDSCGNIAEKVKQTLEEVFAHYAVSYPYGVQKQRGKKVKSSLWRI